MTLSPTTIVSLAEHLDGAERHVRAVPMLTDAHGAFGLDDAYAIQHALRRRKQADGARIVGLKMGLTSRAKMLQVRVDTPIYGFLTAASSCADRARLQTDSLIHPRVEPEIAFSLKAPLRGPGCTIGSVLRATDFVAPALEVIDSRYRDFRFDLPSVVADNASCARHVLGGRVRHVGDVDLRTIGVVLERNGEIGGHRRGRCRPRSSRRGRGDARGPARGTRRGARRGDARVVGRSDRGRERVGR